MSNIIKLSIDIGKYSTKASYLINDNIAFVDFSGGYGEKSILSHIFYSFETDEYIFGEYAKSEMEYSKGLFFDDIISLVEENKNHTLNKNKVSGVEIFSKYIENILEFMTGINPNIEGFEIIFVNQYNNKNFKENVQKIGRFIKNINKIVVLDNISTLMSDEKFLEEGDYLLVDIGHSSLKFYDLQKENEKVYVTNYIENKDFGLFSFESYIYYMFTKALSDKLIEESQSIENYNSNIEQLVLENKAKIIDMYKTKKDVKIYFDFITPPFAHTVNNSDVVKDITTVSKNIKKFLEENLQNDKYKNIAVVGYGVNFLYLTEVFQQHFNNTLILKEDFYTNVALNYFNNTNIFVVVDKQKEFKKDKHKIEHIKKYKSTTKRDLSLGIMAKDFLPIWKSNEKVKDISIFVNQYVENTLELPIVLKDDEDTIIKEHILKINCFENREKGTVKLNIKAKCINNKNVHIFVKDLGFGDIYNSTNYMEEFVIKV